MDQFKSKNYPIYANFLNKLAKDLTNFYHSKLNRTFKVSNKLKGKGYDPVTTSDKAFEKFIRSKIKSKFSNHQIVGEEFGHTKSNSDFTWVIDPIDGTFNFLHGIPHFAISIAHQSHGEIISGLIFDPIKNEMFYAEKNFGAYLNNISLSFCIIL